MSIPASITELDRDWALESSLEQVLFDSGASLRRMLANGTVDLTGSFEIWTWLTDGNMDFDNYSQFGAARETGATVRNRTYIGTLIRRCAWSFRVYIESYDWRIP
jgi:hypothetical protein